MTGCFGGVMRDTLCNMVPVIFLKEIYATASIAGGVLYIVLFNLDLNSDVIYISTAGLIIIIRLLVVKFSVSLPSFYVVENNSEGTERD